ncbi:hypothetical protein PENANT_c130G04942 [Penicillium antarcticum]|uniref:Uncharacterized protein n=1 Tax=Penicillium antarcticum TaxID=416450 RepID=A0A1V6PH24_9EURO|nr:hypothetical protein PENANT_c130G04942 [Penicillium antarcticum]
MTIPSRSMTIIEDEFRRLKCIREIGSDEDILAFLQDAQSTLKYKGLHNPRGPLKRSLIHYAAMGDCTELLLYLLQDGTAKDDIDQNKPSVVLPFLLSRATLHQKSAFLGHEEAV